MSYRPLCDTWLCARPKVKNFYGCFPSGFLERARAFLCHEDEPLLHVCSGMVKKYPFAGFGSNDKTVDLDPLTEPDFLMDVRQIGDWVPYYDGAGTILLKKGHDSLENFKGWPAVLIDRPYSQEDAQHYAEVVRDKLPNINDLLKRCLSIVRPGGKVGVLDYFLPRPPKEGVKFVACVSVMVGFGNRARTYSVFERMIPRTAEQKERVKMAIRGKI